MHENDRSENRELGEDVRGRIRREKESALDEAGQDSFPCSDSPSYGSREIGVQGRTRRDGEDDPDEPFD